MIKAVICVWCGAVVPQGVRRCVCGQSPKAHKYGVAAKKDRTYKDIPYASKLEAKRAAELDVIFPTLEYGYWLRQVLVQLGPDFKTRVDFMCCLAQATDAGILYVNWFEEVKGKETADFKRVRRLWGKYGPKPLNILKRKGNGWATEVIE